MIRFTGEVQGVEVMNRAFSRVEERISDFRFIWPSFAATFYEIEREQFASEGSHGLSGKWKPLSPAYKAYKAIAFPNMPILQATTALYQSMTTMDASDSIFRPEADQLTIGTQREGATAHQRTRPVISLTEADKRRLQKAIQLPLVQFIRKQGFLTEAERAA